MIFGGQIIYKAIRHSVNKYFSIPVGCNSVYLVISIISVSQYFLFYLRRLESLNTAFFLNWTFSNDNKY